MRFSSPTPMARFGLAEAFPAANSQRSAHKAGVKVLVSLGGWGWDKQFAAIVSKPEAEDRYAKSVMAIVDDNDYDGIDLDWEYPDTKEEVVGFERLTRRFRKELDAVGAKKGRPMFVTMAASSNPGTLKWLAKDFLLETMDWINVMTYDFTGDWTNYAGHHSPLFASSKQPGGSPRSTELTMKYLLDERGLPADRLAVGIPLYGRGFGVAEPYASTKGAKKTGIPRGDYRNLHPLATQARLDEAMGRRDQEPVAGFPRACGRRRLRRRRVSGTQNRMGHEEGFSRGVFLANRRRPVARRHQSTPGSVAQEAGRERAESSVKGAVADMHRQPTAALRRAARTSLTVPSACLIAIPH